MNSWMHDLRFSWRTLVRSPMFAVTAIVTLALGIGANTAIFSVVHGVLLRPLPYENPDRLVRVFETDPTNDSFQENASAPDLLDWKNESTSFELLAGMTSGPVNLTGDGTTPERLTSAGISHGFFALIGRGPVLGRSFTIEEDRVGAEPVVILSHDLWQRRFGGDSGILGRTVAIDGANTTVVGVMAEGFNLPEADVWTPLTPSLAFPEARGVHNIRVLGRLTDGVSIEAAQAEMDVIAKKLADEYPEDNVGRGVSVELLDEVVVSGVRPALMILLGSVALILLIACANVSGLMMTRAGARVRELAVRKSLGASRLRLARLLLTESLLLGLIGCAAGVGLAYGLVKLFIAMQPGYLPRADSIEVSGTVLLFALSISIVASLIFGIAPAFQSSSATSGVSLRTGFGPTSRGGHSQRVRQILVVAQVAMAVILVIGAGLLVRTFLALTSVNPGFRAEGVLTMDLILPESRYPMPGFDTYPDWPEVVSFYDRALERAGQIPGVESVAIALNHPLDSGFTSQITVDGRPQPDGPHEESRVRPVTPDFFKVTSIQLIRGRMIDDRDRHGSPDVLLINDAFAERLFPGENPVGASVTFWGRSKEIVGVIGDVHFQGLAVDSEPAIYPPLHQVPMGMMSLLVRTRGDHDALTRTVQNAIWEVEPTIAFFNVETLEQKLESSVGAPKFHMILMGLFGGLALLLAAVGVYGLLSYQVLQRTSEIGIRVALGATRENVLRLFLSDGFRVVMAGVLIGILGALGINRVMVNLLFGVTPGDAMTFVGVPLILGLVGLAASLLPAIRASRLDPMRALRWE